MRVEREILEVDILIVGAGPAGLSAAIKLAQLNKEHATSLSIAVIEKGSQVGSHILSGAAIEPRALNELFPNWQELKAPLRTPATKDEFYLFTKRHAIRLPTPPQMRNGGNYIISLGEFCQWLASQAEQLGVNVFSGFAGAQICYENDRVTGVITGDKGLDKHYQPTARYQPGIKILAKQTLFAEGCRGSLTKMLIHKFKLDEHSSPQTYGIGVKELWEISKANHQKGKIVHSFGWPLDAKTYGGSFIYHMDENLLAIGYVVGLDYKNPYLDPFAEFQRFKTHPKVRHLFESAKRICYGARALCEGGYQSIPKLSVKGGLIIGDSAGFLNVPKIKGTHTAMKSGMIAAETIFANLKRGLNRELSDYNDNIRNSWIGKELYEARNLRPSFQPGLFPGLIYSAIDTYVFRGRAPWTFKNHADHTTLKPARVCKKIDYPKPDNQITFDKLSSLYLANLTYHENQPNHLQILNPKIPIEVNLEVYDSPESRYCPAAVYSIVDHEGSPKLQIDAGNCVQCKTCDIKDPLQNINWVPPEGDDGPNYVEM